MVALSSPECERSPGRGQRRAAVPALPRPYRPADWPRRERRPMAVLDGPHMGAAAGSHRPVRILTGPGLQS